MHPGFIVEERKNDDEEIAKAHAAGCLFMPGFRAHRRADVVTDWNAIAIQTILGGERPAGGSPFLDIATVHLAVHDAVAAIDGQFRPYHVVVPDASGSPVAATAKAAYDILVNRFPPQTASLTIIYTNYLASKTCSVCCPH